MNAPATGLSPEQIRQRIGCLTASNMRRALAMLKNGKSSEDRESYKRELVAERLVGFAMEHYVTPAMQWGIDNEGPAKDAYTWQTGNFIEPMQTIPHPIIPYFLATPDGRIEADIGVEVKCPTSSKFVSWKLAGVVPDEHKPQMIAQCLCAGFSAVEFIAYDPRMPDGQRLFVRRFVPTAEELAAVEAGAVQFLAEVEEMFEAFTTSPAVAEGASNGI
jgi:hypothetical protein